MVNEQLAAMESILIQLIKSSHWIGSPIGLLTVALFVALFCHLRSFHTFKKLTIAIGLTIFYLCSIPLSTYWIEAGSHLLFSTKKLNQQVNVNTFSDQHYDAILVAGWQKAYSPSDPLRHQYWSWRLWSAAKQYHKQNSPIVVVSSQYPLPDLPKASEDSYATIKLIELGVKREDIVTAQLGRATIEAIKNGYLELEKLNASSILLVGYRYRLNRKWQSLASLYSGKSVNIYLLNAGTNEDQSRPPAITQISSWLPNEKDLARSSALLHEVFGQIAYRFIGWI